MLRNVWAVVRREYVQRVRSKWFVIATVGGPLLMMGFLVVPAYLAERDDQVGRSLRVVDGTGILYERVAEQLVEGGFTVAEQPWSSDVVDELRGLAERGEIGGFVFLDELTLETGEAVLYTTSRPSPLRRVSLGGAIVRAALEYQLEQRGVDAAAMLAGGTLRIELLSGSGADTEDPEFAVAYIGAFFLYMVILLYAVAVMRATLEEKTSRVVEIIISSMDPWHLMLGKIVGVCAVGLTQLAVWIVSGALLVAAGLPSLIAARPEMAGLGQVVDVLPGAGLLILFVVFFLCGFFMYSGLYAAVGAMCNSDEEAQQAQLPVILLIVVPILILPSVIENPATPMSTGLSLFPFFAPILMWGRVAGGGAPAWQVGVSVVLMLLAILAVAWVAGRIYKVGILMSGKRPTLPELWRWVREA